MKSLIQICLSLGIIWTATLVHVDSYKIFMIAGGSKSHKYVFDAVAGELEKRGHEVSLYSPIKIDKSPKGIKDVYLAEVAEGMKEGNVNFFQGTMQDSKFLTSMIKLFVTACNATYTDPAIQEILKNPRDAKGQPKFDVVMIDSIFGEFALPLAYHMKVPAIYLSPSLLFPSSAWRLNIPYPYSYLSSGMDEIIHPETMYERAANVFKILGFSYYQQFEIQPAYDEVIADFLPGVPTVAELERQVSFAMINWHTAVYPSAPRMPYFVDVGCLNCHERKPLPKDLEEFMNSSPNGVVYFSLGSYTQGSNMPQEMTSKLATSFAKLKQNVLFKYETPFEGLSSNVKLIKWAPQNDLLGHPKMKLFITHGGGLSMMESAYNGCPQLAFPLSADQHANMAFAREKGFAEVLDWKTFTVEEFDEKLKLMLNNESYKENAAKVSLLMRDNPQDPKEKAAYWVEYIIRHKGAPHLKTGADKLNFVQYFLLDVVGALIFVVALVLFVIFAILRAIYRLIFLKNDVKKSKMKSN